jgi:hypothetical protein
MPLTFRDRGTQLDIISGDTILGSLRKIVLSGVSRGTERWAWSWQAGPASGPDMHGTAGTIDEAKAILQDQWRAWLEAAGLIERSD